MLPLLVVFSALASEETPELVELAEVLASSDLVAVVRDAEPASETATQPMKGTKELFHYTVRHAVVDNVLFDSSGTTKKGDSLHIGPGDLAIQWGIHRVVHVDHASESPIIETYASPVDPREKAEPLYIVMLDRCMAEPGILEMRCFTVVDAMESVENLRRIEGMLKVRSAPPQSQ